VRFSSFPFLPFSPFLSSFARRTDFPSSPQPRYHGVRLRTARLPPSHRLTLTPSHSAIGGGGFFPARVLRTFLKRVSGSDGARRNIPIQAIGLSLYEEVGAFDGSNGLAQEEKLGKEVIRTQWLDFSTLGSRPLVGRRILIVVRLSLLFSFLYSVSVLPREDGDCDLTDLPFSLRTRSTTPVPPSATLSMSLRRTLLLNSPSCLRTRRLSSPRLSSPSSSVRLLPLYFSLLLRQRRC